MWENRVEIEGNKTYLDETNIGNLMERIRSSEKKNEVTRN